MQIVTLSYQQLAINLLILGAIQLQINDLITVNTR